MNRVSSFEGSTGAASRSRSADLFYRIGYACHGAIHLVIGYLAISLAMGEGGQLAGPKGAMTEIAEQPFGKFILLLLGIGLLGYVAWKFAQAFGNIGNDQEAGWKGTLQRLARAGSGIVYLSFAYFAIRAFTEGAAGSSQGSSMSSQVLGLPGGKYTLMAVGIGIAITGFQQIYKGFSERFLRSTDARSMSPEERKVLRYSGKIGLPARGLTLAIIGYLLLRTGIEHQPRETGTKGALEVLMNQPYGTTVLGIIAAGFIAYAIYCFLAARHQRFVT